MLTRIQLRHALKRPAAIAGAIAVPLLLFCFFGSFVARVGGREFAIADGAIQITWPDSRMAGGLATLVAPPAAPDPDGVFLRPSTGQWAWRPEWAGPSGFGEWGAFILPLWIPITLGALAGYFLLPPGTSRGHCRACDYDLRGIPRAPDGSLKCPECGDVV